jgi:hypothetical protein
MRTSSEWVSSWATSGGREGRTDAFTELAGMALGGHGEHRSIDALSAPRSVLELGMLRGETRVVSRRCS